MLGMGPGETPHGRPRCHGLLGARAGATCYPPAHAPGVRGSSSSTGRRGVDAGSTRGLRCRPLPGPRSQVFAPWEERANPEGRSSRQSLRLRGSR